MTGLDPSTEEKQRGVSAGPEVASPRVLGSDD
jgi:hypothetical protein